jgi:hypothetical protein
VLFFFLTGKKSSSECCTVLVALGSLTRDSLIINLWSWFWVSNGGWEYQDWKEARQVLCQLDGTCLIQSVLECHLKCSTLKNQARTTSANCKDNMLDLGEK